MYKAVSVCGMQNDDVFDDHFIQTMRQAVPHSDLYFGKVCCCLAELAERALYSACSRLHSTRYLAQHFDSITRQLGAGIPVGVHFKDLARLRLPL